VPSFATESKAGPAPAENGLHQEAQARWRVCLGVDDDDAGAFLTKPIAAELK
jgi:hypothetical protein